MKNVDGWVPKPDAKMNDDATYDNAQLMRHRPDATVLKRMAKTAGSTEVRCPRRHLVAVVAPPLDGVWRIYSTVANAPIRLDRPGPESIDAECRCPMRWELSRVRLADANRIGTRVVTCAQMSA